MGKMRHNLVSLLQPMNGRAGLGRAQAELRPAQGSLCPLLGGSEDGRWWRTRRETAGGRAGAVG